MGLLRIYSTKSKTKRKPGWEKEQAEYDAWLAGLKGMKLFENKKPTKSTTKKIDPVVKTAYVETERLQKLPSRMTPGDSSTKPVIRPEIMYKGNPEMIEREREARARKFATAPAYNKGAAQLVTEDMMRDITAGKTRRR